MRFYSEAMSGVALHASGPRAACSNAALGSQLNSLYPVLSGYPCLTSSPISQPPSWVNLNRTDISHGKSRKAPGTVHTDNPSPAEVEAGRCLCLLNHNTLKVYPCSTRGRISFVKCRTSHWTEMLHFVTCSPSMDSGSSSFSSNISYAHVCLCNVHAFAFFGCLSLIPPASAF